MAKVTSLLLCLVYTGLVETIHITVYQSPLTYYDSTWDSPDMGWVKTSKKAKEITFTSWFECQFLVLPFEFPFYADKLSKIGVTKLGFIYTGPYTNARLTELLHIAPLMNLYSADQGTVVYETIVSKDGSSSFVIEWNDLTISNGTAHFQVQLYLDGTIVFAYKKVSLSVLDKALISIVSSFPWRSAESASSDLVYYKYEEITEESTNVQNKSTLVFTLRTNCQSAGNCSQCSDIGLSTAFSCSWCNELQRCSDTFDNRYAEWAKSCSATAITECPPDDEFNITLRALSDLQAQKQLSDLQAWFEAFLISFGLGYDDKSCSTGLFYNPYTGSCNDCVYCASEECDAACSSGTQAKTRNDPLRNVKVHDYKFGAGDSVWKSGFIGLVCGLGLCMCIGMLLVCMRRRNYTQPGGVSWSLPTAEQNAAADKPLIYGTSAPGREGV